MNANVSLLVKLMFIGLLFSAGAIGSVSAISNLSISKFGFNTTPENITWTIKVTNYNETEVNVNVTEIIPIGCDVIDNSTTDGKYENGEWSFSMDSAIGISETLTLNMTCYVACNKTKEIKNIANITKPDDVPVGNKSTWASVTLEGGECLPVTIKPETINIKKVGIQTNGKGGVITVFITIGEAFNKTDILDDSVITCNEADAERILFSEKDDGTIIAKFRRSELDVTADGEITEISCYGEINTTAKKFIIEGSDIVRSIHADDQTSLLDRILRLFGIGTGTNEELDNVKNIGQFKKLMREPPTVTTEGEEEDNEVSPALSEKGEGKSKGLEIEQTLTSVGGNGKGRGQGKPADENSGRGRD